MVNENAVEILNICIDLLERSESFALATIISVDGRKAPMLGARIVIDTHGSICGTLGGGELELLAVRNGLDAIKDKKSGITRYYLATSAAIPGCNISACAEVFIEYIEANEIENHQVFVEMLACLNDKTGATLVTVMEDVSGVMLITKSIIKHTELLDPKVPTWVGDKIGQNCVGFQLLSIDANRKIILEELVPRHRICIFGAGPMGLRLAELAHFIGIDTLIIDHRDGFSTPLRYPHSHGHYTVANYRDVFSLIDIDEHSYLVITMDDPVVLSNLIKLSLRTRSTYICITGSQYEIELSIHILRNEGLAQDELRRLNIIDRPGIPQMSNSELALRVMSKIIDRIYDGKA